MADFLSVPGRAVPGQAIPGDVTGTAPPAPASWPPWYTTNFCPNPSVEVSAQGYAPLRGTETLTRYGIAWAGQWGLQVTTSGTLPAEGISTPPGQVIAPATGSASFYVYGEPGVQAAVMTANAVTGTGQILGATQFQLAAGWQRIELDNLILARGSLLQLLIYTSSAQAVTFVIDAVQYEPETPAHEYTDGDAPSSAWDGTTGLSSSYTAYQNPVAMSGSMVLEGSITLLAQGEVIVIGPLSGQMDASGDSHPMTAVSGTRAVIPPAVDTGIAGLPWQIAGGGQVTSVTLGTPGSAVSAFGIWETGTDPDPAMTMIGYNNAGTPDSAEDYTRIYATFSPPQQALDSAGTALWQTASYMAAGFRIAGQGTAAADGVNVTQVQVEKALARTPSAYQLPRSLNTVVKATGMNYVTNPSMEAGLEGWTAIGGATLTQAAGGFQGSYSLQVSVPSAGGGAYIVVPDLITGDTFIASAYIQPVSDDINDITMAAGATEVSSNPSGYLYGEGDYGSGPYGGINLASASMVTGSWAYRPWTSFTPGQSAVVLSFIPVAATGAVYPLVFRIDCVMVSPGEVLGAYADGSTDEWQWETGGTPGLSRSYWYERQNVAANAVMSVLDTHIPLGLTAAEPLYALPPAQ